MRKLIVSNRKLIGPLASSLFSWHKDYFLKRKPHPLSCSFFITNKCNYDCAFCFIRRDPEKFDFHFDNFSDFITSLGREKCFYFSVSGGEPLMAKDVFALLEHARRSGIAYRHLVTNGYFLTREVAQELKRVGLNEISISLDIDEETHIALRNNPKAYKRAIGAIENILEYGHGINIAVNSIFHPAYVQRAYRIVALTKELGVYVKFQPIIHLPVFGTGEAAADEQFQYDRKDLSLREELAGFIDFIQTETHVVNSKAYLQDIFNLYFDPQKMRLYNQRCILGYHHLEVYRGRLFPCLNGMLWRGGFPMDRKLEDILSQRAYRNKLKALARCTYCNDRMPICYYEPRLTFPIRNYLKFSSPASVKWNFPG